MFRREQALQFKEDQLAELQAIYAPPDAPPRLIIFTPSLRVGPTRSEEGSRLTSRALKTAPSCAESPSPVD
jgi:hypothetical protein